MKKISVNQAREIKGAAAHYHWKCTVNGFVSKPYSTRGKASDAADSHENKYKTHASNIIVYYCESNKCK